LIRILFFTGVFICLLVVLFRRDGPLPEEGPF
jgi:hypothetical protein